MKLNAAFTTSALVTTLTRTVASSWPLLLSLEIEVESVSCNVEAH